MSPPSRIASAGNTVTAQRYARIFRSLGHRCRIAPAYGGEDVACLVALHARKSAKSVLAYRAAYPRRRIILVLTGTDVYRDIRRSRLAVRALEAADVLVTLQPQANRELPAAMRRKARAIVQSAPSRKHAAPKKRGALRICVLGHLRAEKDPMRTAYAVRTLDSNPMVQVLHAGALLAPQFAQAVKREGQRNTRYCYLGPLPRSKAMALLARCDLLVQSSRMEGGANAVCEAIACGTPVLASRISGNVGILGANYPGLYDVGDTAALAQLIERAATSSAFYARLQDACEKLRPLIDPQAERAAWESIL